MNPRSCQQLPFSTFSLTFLFWQGLLSLQQQLRGRWAQAGWQGSPRGLGLLGPQEGAPPASSSPGQNKLSFKTQKILWVKPEFLLSLHYSFKHPGNATHRPPSLCRPRALQGRAAEARRLEKSGCAETKGCYHRNWTSPLKLCFLTHTHAPRKGKGPTAVLFFTDLSGRVWFCCHCFFQCRCVFSSLWVPVSRCKCGSLLL